MNHHQEARGRGNNVLHINPDLANHPEINTNVNITKDQMQEYLQDKIRLILLIIVVCLVIMILMLTILMFSQISFLGNQLENIQYKLDFT